MYEGIRVSAIAAVASNGTIGIDGGLPWRIPGDLKHFQRHTRRHACIMGRRTFDELKTPLKRRLNVVLSRSLQREAARLEVVRSLEQALAVAHRWELDQVAAERIAEAEIFVIGGAAVWEAAWPLIDRFYLTRVLADVPGDTAFPQVDLSAFEQTDHRVGEGPLPHEFVTLERIR